MVATWFDDGILLPTSFEILVSDVINGYVLPIVRISINQLLPRGGYGFYKSQGPYVAHC